MMYSHRNGESEPPIIKGKYWFVGKIHHPNFSHDSADIVELQTHWHTNKLFIEGEECNHYLEDAEGQWYGPLIAPWDAQPAQPLVPDDVMKAIGTLMIEAAGGHEPPYDAPQFPGDKPTEFYLVEKWLDDAQRPSLGDDNA